MGAECGSWAKVGTYTDWTTTRANSSKELSSHSASSTWFANLKECRRRNSFQKISRDCARVTPPSILSHWDQYGAANYSHLSLTIRRRSRVAAGRLFVK